VVVVDKVLLHLCPVVVSDETESPPQNTTSEPSNDASIRSRPPGNRSRSRRSRSRSPIRLKRANWDDSPPTSPLTDQRSPPSLIASLRCIPKLTDSHETLSQHAWEKFTRQKSRHHRNRSTSIDSRSVRRRQTLSKSRSRSSLSDWSDSDSSSLSLSPICSRTLSEQKNALPDGWNIVVPRRGTSFMHFDKAQNGLDSQILSFSDDFFFFCTHNELEQAIAKYLCRSVMHRPKMLLPLVTQEWWTSKIIGNPYPCLTMLVRCAACAMRLGTVVGVMRWCNAVVQCGAAMRWVMRWGNALGQHLCNAVG
jgi:hypothetical protein